MAVKKNATEAAESEKNTKAANTTGEAGNAGRNQKGTGGGA